MLSPSPSEAVPQTMLSPSVDVPHTMLSQSAPPHSVPQTMLSASLSAPVPQTILRARNGSEGSHSTSREHALVPQATGDPSGVTRLPQITSRRHALAVTPSSPPPTRRLPQLIRRLHAGASSKLTARRRASSSGAAASPALDAPIDRASSTAPRALRNPAPCASAV